MEQFDIFISIEAENVIILGHHLYFVVSALLNGVALYCLCKQAPEIQSEIKFYLYYMKLSAAIAKAFSASGLAFAYQWFITFSMLACIWRRHQALVMGRFKFGKVLNNVFIFFIFVMSCARYMFGFFANFDQSESELLIDRENLGWMRERGPHVIYRRTRETALILPLMLLASHALDNLIGIALISHVMWNIRHGKLDESEVAIEPVLHDAIPAAAAATTIKHLPNRLRDSAHLFGEMLRSKFLLSSAFILFLNKVNLWSIPLRAYLYQKDLLSKKLISQPLGKYIKGYGKLLNIFAKRNHVYTDGKTTEDASDFIRQYFLKRKSKKDKDRAIYGHYTCATDTKNVEFVFNAACDIVFKKNISKSGMQ
ncbi:hypothetical protein PRIPAC_80505 [Pristionchus pacificus]|uniref:Uncharacterized protein n=1 Tax=Pristionchus pacificus TaxID=54126 RepID=A0A2A6CJD3_PRIPA|nr:hypothetical protein PRIPAC_80505 [Pristionchus pacificus]|eukprot:PDM78334.1 hypothetical protein PRIPAC_30913 [Pristionchus pacificus]